MLDVTKYLNEPRLLDRDPTGAMADLPPWSPRVGARLAAEDGLTLEDAHWQVLYCLREQYRVCADQWTARQLLRNLAHDYADVGGRRYLYQLFPKGPITQGCRIAGLPLPPDAVDRSFGSVH